MTEAWRGAWRLDSIERRQFGDVVVSLVIDVRTYEGMSAASPVSLRRYRRRILALGATVFVVVFAIGSAITMPIVQNDREDRVEDELLTSGVVGVTASFSGQDGTLVCAEPLDDAERARGLAERAWGVRSVALDETCVENGSPGDAEPAVDGDDDAVTTTLDLTTTTSQPPAATDPVPDPLADRIAGDPLFSQFADLVDATDLAGAEALAGNDPLTVFAPTDAAFDLAFEELGADAFGALTSDPEAIRTLLLHHMTEGSMLSTELTSGPLTMLAKSGTIL